MLAGRGIDGAELLRGLSNASLPLIAVAVLSILVTTVLKTVRWQRLLGNPSLLPDGSTFRALVVGQFINNAFPLRAGDVARVYLSGRIRDVTLGHSIGSVVLEKLVDSAALVVLLIVALLLAPFPDTLRASAVWMAAILTVFLIATICAVSIAPFRRRSLGIGFRMIELIERIGMPERIGNFLVRHTSNALRALDVFQHFRQAIVLVLLTSMIWISAVATNVIVIEAMNLPVGLSAATVWMIVLTIGASIPGLPGRIGAMQYLSIAALAPFGIAQADSLAAGIVLHVVVFGPMWAMGGVFVFLAARGGRNVADRLPEDGERDAGSGPPGGGR